jgi:uncharacterized SAM-binding protein YcdF (DUF218 family)
MIYLHKLLPLLVSPLGVALLLWFASWWFKRKSLSGVGVVLLVCCASPWFANWTTKAVEGAYVWSPPTAAPKVDAVVVLSGMLTSRLLDQQTHWEWGDADRFWGGVELWQAQRAPILVFTGGHLPWSMSTETEGQALKSWAVRLGLPEDKVLVSGHAMNTADESHQVRQLLPKANRIVLVTSAFHMPRSVALFERQGFQVHPWPVDFHQSDDRLTPMDFVPNARDLERTSRMWREVLGRWYYRLKP